jgi:hypothetical protein
MDICLLWVFVLSSRSLCDELIPRPVKSHRLWCVVECDLENLKNEEAMTRDVLQRHKKKSHNIINLWDQCRICGQSWPKRRYVAHDCAVDKRRMHKPQAPGRPGNWIVIILFFYGCA